MKKVVGVGSKVTALLYLGRILIMHLGQNGQRRRYFEYELTEGLRSYLLTDNHSGNPEALHPDSFLGRALMGRSAHDEVEVNVGGLSVDQVRVGQATGNHLRYKIIGVE